MPVGLKILLGDEVPINIHLMRGVGKSSGRLPPYGAKRADIYIHFIADKICQIQ